MRFQGSFTTSKELRLSSHKIYFSLESRVVCTVLFNMEEVKVLQKVYLIAAVSSGNDLLWVTPYERQSERLQHLFK